MLLFTKPTAFGLDLSDLSMKLALLKKNSGKISLASFGRQEVKEGIIESGVIKKEPELILLIKEAVAKAKGEKIKTKYCIVSLPETESYIRVIQLPKIKKEEIGEAIKWELEANIPVAISDVYYDWQIVSRQNSLSGHHEILIGALPKALVDPYLGVIKKAGLCPLAFEIESIATARSLVKERINESIMIVDMGAKRTSVIVYAGGAVCLTTSLAISNNLLIEDIAKALNIPLAKAKTAKFKIGLDPAKEKGKVAQAMEPRLIELASEINKYLDYCRTTQLAKDISGLQIAKIFLCGGGANLKGLTAFLSSQIKIKIEIGNPWINIFGDAPDKVPELAFDESLAYTTALGLALRGI